MLKALKLTGYRGFKDFELAELKHVNLLVGKNNCGKTSILEAVEFLVSGGNAIVLHESAQRRGELDEEGAGIPDISHVFYGHKVAPIASRFEL